MNDQNKRGASTPNNHPPPEVGPSLRRVADEMKLDKSVVSRHLANPLKHGFVRDLNLDADRERRPGRKAAYAPGDSLPGKMTALPTADEVERAYLAQVTR